ncbi:MAG: hypothetical protein FWE37_08345 [Spirochaetaceae bacterium]|nr:hypothetical protein [Spirochaetaceae bacterium]
MDAKKQELLELYRIMVESSANNENKRLKMNMLYTTLIVGIYALMGLNEGGNIYLPLIAIAIAFIWGLTINHYRLLAQAKYDAVILELEKAFEMPIFAKEWEYLKKHSPKLELTKIERLLPLIIIILSTIIFMIEVIQILL